MEPKETTCNNEAAADSAGTSLPRISPTPTGGDALPHPPPPPPTDNNQSPSRRSHSASASPPSPSLKQKLIQKQLILLLHAERCLDESQAIQMIDGAPPRQCQVHDCETMKQVVAHMRTCQDERHCKVEHCTTSRKILSHWHMCKDWLNCSVCKDVRREAATNPLPPQANHQWHSGSDDEATRRYLIDGIVKGLARVSAELNVARLYAFAQQTECEVFSTAATRELYHNLLAERISKTRQELEEELANLKNNQQPPAPAPNHQIILVILPPNGAVVQDQQTATITMSQAPSST